MNNNDDKASPKTAITALHIAPTPFFSDRGCHMRIKGVIGALGRRNIHSVLCTYSLGRDVAGIETVRTMGIPGYTKVSAGPSPFKYLADILLFFKICGQIMKRQPPLIHAHLHEGALLAWAARMCFFWKKIDIVFDMQGSLVGELEAHGYFNKMKFLRRLFWFIEYLITRMPDYFVCSSENSINILREEFNVNPEDIRLANDGVDLNEPNVNKINRIRQELAVPSNVPVVIYSGALQEVKGLSNLCDTILAARQRGLQCHFVIVGYPEQSMIEFADNNDLQDYCTMTGRVPFEALSNYLALASVAIEPKKSDSGEASGKLLNYMGAGLPVICFDTPNNRQLLQDCGYYADVKEAASNGETQLVDQLALVLENGAEARQRGEQGRQRVVTQYSWDATVGGIYDIYQKCLT